MKKIVLILAFTVVVNFAVFAQAQYLPTVAVSTFDVTGGISQDDARTITELFFNELASSGKVNVIDRNNFDKIVAEMKFQSTDWSSSAKTAELGRVSNANYIVRGQLMKLGDSIVWTASMIDVNTAQILYTARTQVDNLSDIYLRLQNFITQMVSKMPPPNYLIGKWKQTITYRGRNGLTCILDIKSNGTIVIERYDVLSLTFRDNREEKNISGTVIGTGIYSINSNEINIVLTLDGMPLGIGIASSISYKGGYNIDTSKNNLTLTGKYGFLCFNSINEKGFIADDFYTSFIRIQ
jgi:TolB-like protein